MMGHDPRTFEQAISEQLHPEALERARAHHVDTDRYLAWGEYGRILAGYFDTFPREQILVVYTDERSGTRRASCGVCARSSRWTPRCCRRISTNATTRVRPSSGSRG